MLNYRVFRLFFPLAVSLGLLISSVSCGGGTLPTDLPGQATAGSMGGASPSVPTTSSESTPTTSESADRVYPVELIAKPGILQGHGRDETEYRDLTPGSAFLASGLYLRTLEGGAAVVLPDNSVMRMDANTEVQVGMYDNGIMIWQRSGRTYHFVMPQEGTIYDVATPFGTVVAHGTEFEVLLDYPAAGWVVVYWGEIGVVETQNVIDPVTGQITGTRDVYGLVPESAVLLGPDGSSESWTLRPGETLTFVIDPVTGRVVASPGSPPSNNDWSIRNDMIAEVIRQLVLRYQEGIYSADEYRAQLNDLMQQALGLTEEEPELPEDTDVTPVLRIGRLWGGMIGDNQAVTFCYDGSYISMIHWVTNVQRLTLDTGERWSAFAVFTIDNAIVVVNNHGDFQLIYQVDQSLWPNFGILFEGNISGGGGQVLLNGQGLTEVEHSWTDDQWFQVQATTADCTY